MNLAVRVVILTALFVGINLLVSGEQRDSLSALIRNAKDEDAKVMLYLQLADSKENERVAALREAESLFKSNQNNAVGIETYLKFGNYFKQVNQKDSALFYFEKALGLSEIFNDQFYRGRSNQEIGNYYHWVGDQGKAYEYRNKAREIFTSMRDTFWLLPQLNFLAEIELSQSNIAKAERLFQDVINKGLHPRDQEAIAVATLGLGNINLIQKNFSGAFEYLKSARKILEQSDDSDKLPVVLNKLGAVYLEAGLDSLAMKMFGRAAQLNRSRDREVEAEADLGMATVLFRSGDSDGAMVEVTNAMTAVLETDDNRLYTAAALKKAEINFSQGDYPTAQILLEGALNIIEEKGPEIYKPDILELLARIYYRIGEKDKAAATSLKSLELAKARNNAELIQKNSFMLGQIMNEKGQFISASQMLLVSNQIKDSLSIEKNEELLKSAIIGYEVGKNSESVAVLNNVAGGRRTLIDKAGTDNRLQTLLIISIVLLVLLISFFSILILRGYRNNRKLYNDLMPGKNSENKSSELEKLAVLNNKIFSVISHDLRSPIISIKDSIDFLRQEGLDEETKQEALILSEELTEATLNLLDNLLGWAKNQKKRVDPKRIPVKICDEVRQIETLYRASFNKKEINFRAECSDNVVALADNELINLALRNLISNAVKFTPRGGEIIVKGEIFRNNVLVSVKDTGIGISKEDQQKILAIDTFFTKNGTENESGSGIGLKLVNEFVRVMGGELRIDSSPGQGSIFSFTLPCFDVKKNPSSHESFIKQTIN